jgi:hypothetical protein
MQALIPLLLLSLPAGEWSSDYGACLKRAATEQRPLLVVLERRESVALPTAGGPPPGGPVSGELLGHYVLCRVDVSTAYGAAVADAFHANQFPLTVIIDRTAKRQIYRRAGALSADEWTAALAAHQRGDLPTSAVQTVRKARLDAETFEFEWRPRSSARCLT